MKRNLKHILRHIDVDRDLRPHLASNSGLGDLLWVGPIDRTNRAPIGDLPDGTRFHPVSVIGILYEIGRRPHLCPTHTIKSFTTEAGNLQKFGGGDWRNDVDPRNRKFGCMINSCGELSWPHGNFSALNRPALEVLAVLRKGQAMCKAAFTMDVEDEAWFTRTGADEEAWFTRTGEEEAWQE